MGDDWGFESSAQRSNLGGLFGGASAAPKGDFTHKRPTQGQPAGEAKKGDIQSIFALQAGVFLYKTDANGESALACEVPVGVALLFDQQRHFLYFYKTKTEPLLNIYLSSKFQFSFQESSGVIYASFVDAEKRNWSISFQDQEQADQLTMHVGLICFLYTNRSDVFKFNMSEGTGEALAEGDTAGISWTGYTVSGKKLHGQFGSNVGGELLRVEIGKGGAIEGLERGLIGEGNKSRFVVVVPGHMTDRRLEPNPPDNQTIIFVVTVERVKRVPRAAGRTPTKEVAVDSTPLPFIEDVPKANKPRAVSSARKSAARQPKGVVTTEEEDSDDGRPSQSHQKPFSYTSEPRHEHAPQQHNQNQQQPQYGQNPNQPQYGQQQNPNQPYGQQSPYGQPNQPGYPGQQSPYGQQPNRPQDPYSNALAFPTPQPAPGYADPYAPYQQPGFGQPGFPGQPSPYGQPAPVPAPQPAQTPLPGPSKSGIPTDTLQLMVDERQYKSQIDNKMNTMLVKVDRLTDQVAGVAQTRRAQSDTHTSSGISAKALLNTITRIVVDNERLLNDSNEKSKTIALIRDELSKLRNEKQSVIEENAAYVEGRTKNFSEFTLAHRKKQDALTEEKEQIQIELSELQAKAASQVRKYDTLRQQFKALSDELKTTQADSLRANEARQKSKNEADASLAELGAFKQKYREENRKMTEALTEVEKLTHELKVANEKLDSQAEKIKQQSTDHVLQLQQIDAQRVEERTNLNEQIEQLKALIRSERQQTRAKIDEMEEGFEAQRKEDRAALRAYVETELGRRVDIAVGDAVSQEQTKHSAELQQALIDARKVALEDRNSLVAQMDQLEKVIRDEREEKRQELENLERTYQDKQTELKTELETEFATRLESTVQETVAQEQQKHDVEQAEALAAAAKIAETEKNALNETIAQLQESLKSQEQAFESAKVEAESAKSQAESAKVEAEAAKAQIGALSEANQQLKENSVPKSSVPAVETKPEPTLVAATPEPVPVQEIKSEEPAAAPAPVIEDKKPEEPLFEAESKKVPDADLFGDVEETKPAPVKAKSAFSDEEDDDFFKPSTPSAQPKKSGGSLFDSGSDEEDDTFAPLTKTATPAKKSSDPFGDDAEESDDLARFSAPKAVVAETPAPVVEETKTEEPAAAVVAEPEEAKPEEAQPEEAVPAVEEPAVEPAVDAKPAEVEEPKQAEDAQPEEAKPEEAQPEEAKPEEAQPEEAKPEEAQPEEAKPEEAAEEPAAEEPKADVEEPQVEELKVEEPEPKVEEPKAEEPQLEDGTEPKVDVPEEAQPEAAEPADAKPEETKTEEEPKKKSSSSSDDEFFSAPSTPVKKQTTVENPFDVEDDNTAAPPLPDDDNTKPAEEPAKAVEEPAAEPAVETKPAEEELGVAPADEPAAVDSKPAEEEPKEPEAAAPSTTTQPEEAAKEPEAAPATTQTEAEEPAATPVAPTKDVDPFDADPFAESAAPATTPAQDEDPFGVSNDDPFGEFGTPSKKPAATPQASDPFGTDEFFAPKATTPVKKDTKAWGFDGSDDEEDDFFTKPAGGAAKKPSDGASMFFDAKSNDLDFPIGNK